MLRPVLLANPRALRFFVALLVGVQLTAPVWHICALGGVAAARPKQSHHGQKSWAEQAAMLPPGTALVCICAPPVAPLDPDASRLSGTSSHDHATCLALLLQTMPGQIGALPSLVASRAALQSAWQPLHIATPFCALPRGSRGRAPPKIC